MNPMLRRLPLVGAVILLAVASVQAQWVTVTLPNTPRTADGKPDLTAPVPRLSDGPPDLSGIWMRVRPNRRDNGANNNIHDFMSDGVTAPLRPEFEALYRQRRDVLLGSGRPSEQCLPHGIPDAMFPNAAQFKIIPTPVVTLVLYEEFNQFRQIHTDGRSLPPETQPAWWGYSVGHWDGDTFVVETRGFNDRTWLDDTGHPHTDKMRTTERFHRVDFGHMTLDVTIDDAGAYTAPFSLRVNLELQPDTELIEFICENEKDADRIRAATK